MHIVGQSFLNDFMSLYQTVVHTDIKMLILIFQDKIINKTMLSTSTFMLQRLPGMSFQMNGDDIDTWLLICFSFF